MSFEVYSTLPSAEKIGTVHANGEVIDLSGNQVGKIFGDGKIKGKSGAYIGTVTTQGKFSGEIAQQGYTMDLKGNIHLNKNKVGTIKQIDKGLPKKVAMWGACALLIAPLFASSDANETLVASPEKVAEMIKAAKIEAFKRKQELATIKEKSPFR